MNPPSLSLPSVVHCATTATTVSAPPSDHLVQTSRGTPRWIVLLDSRFTQRVTHTTTDRQQHGEAPRNIRVPKMPQINSTAVFLMRLSGRAISPLTGVRGKGIFHGVRLSLLSGGQAQERKGVFHCQGCG